MTRNELIFTVVVLSIIGVAAFFNFQKAQVLSRDVQRKNDLKSVVSGISEYSKDVGEYPSSRDGKILACLDQGNLRPCDWGQDPLESTASAYTRSLPKDPLGTNEKKHTYVYFSNNSHFQIYAALERSQDIEYNPIVVSRNLRCGDYICNFGISDGFTPLDRDLSSLDGPEETK